ASIIPGDDALTSQKPSPRPAKRKPPSAALLVARKRPPWLGVTVTLAPASGAPSLLRVTLPARLPVGAGFAGLAAAAAAGAGLAAAGGVGGVCARKAVEDSASSRAAGTRVLILIGISRRQRIVGKRGRKKANGVRGRAWQPRRARSSGR